MVGMVAENPGSGSIGLAEAAPLPGDYWRASLPWMALLAWLLLASLTAFALWHMRSSTLREQQRALHTLAVALTDGIERGLEGVEEGLTAVGNALEESGVPAQAQGGSIELRRHVELMPMAQTLWLLDAQGRGRLRSDAIGFPDASCFVPSLTRHGTEGLAISLPLNDPQAATPLVAVAMPLDIPRPAWVAAGIPSSAFLGAFEVALPEDGAHMAVLRQDGAVLASTLEGYQLPSTQGMLVERIRIPAYGLQVQVLRSRDVLLQDWRHSAQIAGALLGLLGLVLGGAVLAMRRAQQRHAQAEQALRIQHARAARLEALGKLAGEVAHDFNNVLGAIVGYGEMAQEKTVPGSAQARQLERLMGAAARGRALTERILTFSRGGARRAVVFALQPVVEEVLEHVRALPHAAGIVVEDALLARNLAVRGDPLQAYQAILNLCANAMQAMPQGGALRVALVHEHIDTPQVLSHSQLTEGDWLKLTVSDQGRGIDPVSMDHLFEPFYTTRAGEGGSGLGLAVVHGAVVEFGGAIDVQSHPGEGAVFALWFPQCVTEGDTVPLQHAFPESPAEGHGRQVMVLDDEPELVRLVGRSLQALGFVPALETDPVHALERLRARPEDFAALLTDERMPGMNGTELVQQLRADDGPLAQLPVLLLSGHGGPLLAERARQLGIAHVLRKPVQRGDLERVMAIVLQSRKNA